MIANEITLKKFFTYTSSVYDIDGNFKGLNRNNCAAKTKASTAAKMIFSSMMCGHSSINELIDVNKHKSTKFKTLFRKREYVPSMHGLRDCIMDTDYEQLEKINRDVITKAKENKIFRNNKVDGLTVMGWDGVDLNETNKKIPGLPEKEYNDGIRSYIKYVCAMNIGPKANIIVNAKQLLETEKIKTKTGKERAKTIGETKMFESMWEETEKITGGSIDVHVFDALFLNQNVVNLISSKNKYFVIRLKDETRDIYQDAKGLFAKNKPNVSYELVEHIVTKNIKYSKAAKKKDKIKTKIRIEKREITKSELGEKKLVGEKNQTKKNSTVEIKEYERVNTRKDVWDDEFELTGCEEKVRVVRSKETSIKNGKKTIQDIYVVTNMMDHDVETIIKIMHLRWNIENCGFRTLKQRYNLEHIYIGEKNAINYIVQMIFLAFNLFELYTKVRLKEKIEMTWNIITRIFETEFQSDKCLKQFFDNS